MKSILCYGDSLTYGANPVPGGARHAFEDRWPGALEAKLGGKVRVFPEGLGGRTTVFDDWYTGPTATARASCRRCCARTARSTWSSSCWAPTT